MENLSVLAIFIDFFGFFDNKETNCVSLITDSTKKNILNGFHWSFSESLVYHVQYNVQHKVF